MIMNLQLFSELDNGFEFDSADFGVSEEVVDTPVDETPDTLEESFLDTNTNEEIEETNDVPPIDEQPFLNIKYNKQDMALSQEEAQTLAQKGMNYDKLQDRLNQVENNVGLQYLNELAQRNGFTIDEMVNHWREQEQQQQIDELVQANIPEEYAKEMLESRKFREQMEAKQREEEQLNSQKKDFDEFLNAFPNVKPEEIPASVWQSCENGIPLKYAYMEYQMANIINENKVLKTQSKNKENARIQGTSVYGGRENVSADPFLDGFDSL